MIANRLIHISKSRLNVDNLDHHLLHHNFKSGGIWMRTQFQEISKKNYSNKSVNFTFYGFLKYSISILLACIPLFIGGMPYPVLILESILLFYISEIHFLFLFPLLIEESEQPITQSIRMVYSIGFISVLINVIIIAVYMLAGLLNFKKPLFNWHVGCYSILIWYSEVKK